MEDNKFDVNDIEAGFSIFDKPEIEVRRNQRLMEDTKRFQYAELNESITRQGGVYPSSKTSSVHIAKSVGSKSIGTRKVTNKNVKKTLSDEVVSVKNIDLAKITRKIAAIVGAVTILVSAGALTYAVAGEKIEDNINQKIEMRMEIKENEELFKEKALTNLLVNGLAEIGDNGRIIIKNNSVDDYYKLNISNIYDVYGYSLILDVKEFDKFIQTVSYNNELYNYIGREQFLTYNGYIDPKDNNPKIEVFHNLMETSIRENVPDSLLERFKEESNVLTFEDIVILTNQETINNTLGGK